MQKQECELVPFLVFASEDPQADRLWVCGITGIEVLKLGGPTHKMKELC